MPTKYEKIPTSIFDTSENASSYVANEIAKDILQKQKEGKNYVLGLATGSTPTRIYTKLIDLFVQKKLSFYNVYTFNLDEYFPMQPDHLQSYVRFMNEHLFHHIDIPKSHIHIPDGSIDPKDVFNYCKEYENEINKLGGIDLQLLGIGRTGHIGFNEPGSEINSTTRLVTLDQITRIDAASDFFGEEHVPRKALTMGIGSIMAAKKIMMMAWGEGKSKIIQKTVEGPVSEHIPATFLQSHPNTHIIIDEAASCELTRIKTPWLVQNCDWNNGQLIRKAVVWLCQKTQKPILKLTNADYMEHGMADLVTEFSSAYQINIRIFNELQATITGWPGGKPKADDSNRPERAMPFPKKVIIFSPHPDDDVISMGGTFIRLVDQGHQVHVAYQTSGNIAVFDDEAVRFADFIQEFNSIYVPKSNFNIYEKIYNLTKNKMAGEVDNQQVMNIKGIIRKCEAKSACRYVGIPDTNIHFLDMPFYETGTIKKKPISEADILIIVDLLQKIQPHQIYAAGDLSDPHGTHRVCLSALFSALDRLKSESWMQNCYVWLYRGAWQEWDVDQIEMAVPLSPEEVMRKRKAIFKHQSQKDAALFPGNDKREFWVRAEDRNHATADTYNQLGLPEYQAIEAFVRYKF